MKILVVEDDEALLKYIEYWLLKDGYKIITSSTGYEALKLIESEKFDLIISDISMPSLSGLELLSYLKNKIDSKIPVILISALDQQSVIMTAIKLGASDFLVKPINYDELLIRVKRFLEV